jgi:hypothetical protein
VTRKVIRQKKEKPSGKKSSDADGKKKDWKL